MEPLYSFRHYQPSKAASSALLVSSRNSSEAAGKSKRINDQSSLRRIIKAFVSIKANVFQTDFIKEKSSLARSRNRSFSTHS